MLRPRRTATVTAVAALLAGSGIAGTTADAATPSAPSTATAASQLAQRGPDPDPAATVRATANFRNRVHVEDIEEHLRAFENIAKRNGGDRAAGSPGYEQSARYVEGILRKAGYRTKRQWFEFRYERINAQSLTVLSGDDQAIEQNPMTNTPGTGPAGVTGALISPKDTIGCAADAWGENQAAGKIALIKRGSCTFFEKSKLAKAAGAVAVVIYNNVPGTLAFATLGAVTDDTIIAPTTGISQEDGQRLVAAMTTQPPEQVIAKFVLDITINPKAQTFNVIAETPRGTPDNVVMVGAHLDSVQGGPGVNDNGSGSATILQVAVQLAEQRRFTNKVRFAWWGAEELGLLGSTHYVNAMKASAPGDLTKIATYLNFDMVASPNHIIGVYDADQSVYPPPPGVTIPEGSEETESLFNDYFDRARQPWIDTQFSGRSDYQAFIANGIPAGGLFTGADGVKNDVEVKLFGGTANTMYDPNYHKSTDTLSRINRQALDVMSDAVAHVVLTLARNTELVNGVG